MYSYSCFMGCHSLTFWSFIKFWKVCIGFETWLCSLMRYLFRLGTTRGSAEKLAYCGWMSCDKILYNYVSPSFYAETAKMGTSPMPRKLRSSASSIDCTSALVCNMMSYSLSLIWSRAALFWCNCSMLLPSIKKRIKSDCGISSWTSNLTDYTTWPLSRF